MAYIGRGLELGQHIKQTLSVSGSPNTTTVYAMDLNATQNSLLVIYGGVVQEPGIAYTVTGSNITFTSTPVTGTSLYIIYLGQELTSISNPTIAQVNTIAIDQAAAMALALGG